MYTRQMRASGMWKSIMVIGPKATPTQSGGLQLRLGTVVTEQPHNTLCTARDFTFILCISIRSLASQTRW